MLGIFKITSVAVANSAAIELAKTDTRDIVAYFPQEWHLTLAVLSPVAMLLLWILKEVWEMMKGDKKDLKGRLNKLEDLQQNQAELLAEIKAMLGHDLDAKIERKISKAFDYYNQGRRS